MKNLFDKIDDSLLKIVNQLFIDYVDDQDRKV
jgi:hypothetical protein